MPITIKDRETITGATSIYTPPIDLSSMSLFTFNMTAHSASGTGPQIEVTWETSDNLEDWLALSGITGVTLTAAGTGIGSGDAKEDQYGRYVRAVITVTGTSPMFNYSLWMNTFASS